MRFFFSNDNDEKKDFQATIKKMNIINSFVINYFFLKKLVDYVESGNVTNFHNIYRFRANLPFIKEGEIVVVIDFH